MMTLSNATLGSLPKGIEGTGHDWGDLTAGIVHAGLGTCHPAHPFRRLHRLIHRDGMDAALHTYLKGV